MSSNHDAVLSFHREHKEARGGQKTGHASRGRSAALARLRGVQLSFSDPLQNVSEAEMRKSRDFDARQTALGITGGYLQVTGGLPLSHRQSDFVCRFPSTCLRLLVCFQSRCLTSMAWRDRDSHGSETSVCVVCPSDSTNSGLSYTRPYTVWLARSSDQSVPA